MSSFRRDEPDRKPTRRDEPERPGETPAQVDPRHGLSPEAMIALQRSAGNAAVMRRLMRQDEQLYTPAHPEREASFPEDKKDDDPQMSRDPKQAAQVPSGEWAIMPQVSAGGGVIGGGTGFTFLLKNQRSGVKVPGWFLGVGLTAGLKGGITISDPGWTDFNTTEVKADDFSGRGEIMSADLTVAVGGSVGAFWFHNVDTVPEPLSIGGLEYGLGFGGNAMVGYVNLSPDSAFF